MPFPEAETIRRAVEKTVRGVLSQTDCVTDGQEFEFRATEDGSIVVHVCLSDDEIDLVPPDQPVEKSYLFKVEVALVDATRIWTSVKP